MVTEMDVSVRVDDKSNKKRSRKKRAAASLLDSTDDTVDTTGNVDSVGSEDAVPDYDIDEPTMEEKLASLDLVNGVKETAVQDDESRPIGVRPSADSVGVLLQQALNADDQALLMECFNTRDEKVIRNSVSSLKPSNIVKLLSFMVSMLQSRGAVVVCVIPWLKSLLLLHSSSIMSQESSLVTLNSLYQLIESRLSNLGSAEKLLSCLDFLAESAQDIDDSSMTPTVVYEDKDDSDGEVIDDMETNEDGADENDEGILLESEEE